MGDAQQQIDLRALELAKEASLEVRFHQREDLTTHAAIREDVGQLAASVGALNAKIDETKTQIIGAINTLRSEESQKRAAIYSQAWGVVKWLLLSLASAVVGMGLYIWQLKTGK